MKRLRTLDPWKISTLALAGVFVTIVTQRFVGDAEAAKPVPVPVASSKQPPAVRAQKILDTAKSTLLKVKADSEGHRNKAMVDVGTAIVEAKSLSGGEDGQ